MTLAKAPLNSGDDARPEGYAGGVSKPLSFVQFARIAPPGSSGEGKSANDPFGYWN
jgi:hypothetical protein